MDECRANHEGVDILKYIWICYIQNTFIITVAKIPNRNSPGEEVPIRLYGLRGVSFCPWLHMLMHLRRERGSKSLK